MILPAFPAIHLKNLKIMACHGVLPHEKEKKQPFLISLDLFQTPPEWRNETAKDEIAQTICYAELCDFIENFVQRNIFNLLETLAQKLSEALLAQFKPLSHLQLHIQKPEAPLQAHFENQENLKNIAVSYTGRKIYPVGIALGSNLGKREIFLQTALNSLNLMEGLEILKISSVRETPPFGNVNQGHFLNQCVTGQTVLNPFALLRNLKKLEREMGRSPSEKWGPRSIDLDLIFYSDFKIASSALNLPHAGAAERDFVLEPLAEIDPHLKIGENSVRSLLKMLKHTGI